MFNKLHVKVGYFYNNPDYVYVDIEINRWTVRQKIFTKMLLKWKYLTDLSLLLIKYGGKKVIGFSFHFVQL